MADMRPIREDLQATVDARRELGPEYEAALVESFVEKLDATIAARVQSEMYGHAPSPYAPSPYAPAPPPPPHPRPASSGNGPTVLLALGSMALGIPLSAIGAEYAGPFGLIIALGAIVLINVAAAAGMRRR